MLFLASAVLGAVGCGGDDDNGGEPTRSKLPAAGDARAAEGQRLVVRTGCLACHRIGGSGNEGPGPDLTRIGDSSDAGEIERALVDPPRAMPSYDHLSAEDRRAIAAYLAGLRTP